MKRISVLVLLLLALGSTALAQRSFQFRLGLPTPSLGIGLEAQLQQDLVALVYGDIFFSGPSFLVGGEVLFKPDLGQFDRDLRGIRPYFGGGLGMGLPSANFLFTLDGGVELALDRDTGVFIGGQTLFNLNGGSWARILMGASFR